MLQSSCIGIKDLADADANDIPHKCHETARTSGHLWQVAELAFAHDPTRFAFMWIGLWQLLTSLDRPHTLRTGLFKLLQMVF